jgi:signal transduction histidine kinase
MSTPKPPRGGGPSIRVRLVIGLALAAIVPTLLVGFLAVRRARRDVEREVVRGHLALVRALGAGLDGTLQDAQRGLALVGAAWAENPDATADATRRLLVRLRRELPLLSRVAVLSVDGALVAGDDLELTRFVGAGSYGGFVGETRFDGGRPKVVISAQARGRTGELVGSLAAEIDLGFVAQSLAAARLPEGAALRVYDGAGRLIASTEPADVPGEAPLRAQHPAVDLALAAADDGSIEQAGVLAAYRNLSSFQTTRGVGWALVLEQPTSAAYALAAATQRDALVVGALVLGLALAAGVFLARALIRPLVRLTARVDAMGKADHGPLVPAPDLAVAPGEIGILARRFDEMARRLDERDKLRAALARGEKLASVGALAAGVAHEINNPLTTILGYANLLLEDRPEGHPDHAALGLVADEARRVQGIVRRLLDYSRAETSASPRAPVDLNALAERVARLIEPTTKSKRLELRLELAEGLPHPVAEVGRLEQVVVNLGQNAVHAMDGPGVITIRTLRPAAPGADTAAPTPALTPEVAIEVEDQGPGIPPDLVDRIFEPFFTTKGPGVGTGLGLAVSQQIALDHGGRIEVKSALGRGSRFRVILPVKHQS